MLFWFLAIGGAAAGVAVSATIKHKLAKDNYVSFISKDDVESELHRLKVEVDKPICYMCDKDLTGRSFDKICISDKKAHFICTSSNCISKSQTSEKNQ